MPSAGQTLYQSPGLQRGEKGTQSLPLRKLKSSEGNGHETRYTACAITCMMKDYEKGT